MCECTGLRRHRRMVGMRRQRALGPRKSLVPGGPGRQAGRFGSHELDWPRPQEKPAEPTTPPPAPQAGSCGSLQSLCVQGFGPVSVEILSATRAASAPRFTRFTRLQPPKQGLLAPFGFGREAGIGLTGRKLRSRSSADLCHNAWSKAAAKAAPLQPTSQAAPPVQPPSQAAPPVPAPMQPVESDSYMDNQEIERLAHAACAGRAEADMIFDFF